MKKLHLIVLVSSLFVQNAFSQPSKSSFQEWSDNKYAMFIHFGLYSQLGGVWEGKNITKGYSEQIQSHAGIHSDVYADVAKDFNPTHWNSDSVVLLAKQAGMRSVVMGAKHHDGFCLFHTKTTDFNVVDATPFKRDIVEELSKSCKKYGLHFGLYFSLIDWHFPQASPMTSHNADFITQEHHEYNKKQLRELLTKYGNISELWFDMGSLTLQQSRELRQLVKHLQPNCIISGRLGNDQGDFSVMSDNDYPDYSLATPWQVPASMYNETWGYRSWQVNVPLQEKVNEKLESLIRTISRGGNYILNIGPKGDGSIVPFEKNVLLEMGKWLHANQEAIYGTHPLFLQKKSPFIETTFKNNKVYCFVFGNPTDNSIVLKGIDSKIKAVSPLLMPSSTLNFKQTEDSITIKLPENTPENIPIRVFTLASDKPITTVTPSIAYYPNLVLTSQNAQAHYSFSGIDYYSSYRSTVSYSWQLNSTQRTLVKPIVRYSEEEQNKTYQLLFDDKATNLSLSNGVPESLPPVSLKWGTIAICGNFSDAIHQLPADLSLLNMNQKWGEKDWQKKETWKVNTLYTEAIHERRSLYWLTEVFAETAGEVLVRFPANDGLAVYLNRQEVLVINNPLRTKALEKTVLLSLKKGDNQLLVKNYNRFGKNIQVGIRTNVPQRMYRKKLPYLFAITPKPLTISLKLPNSFSKHQNIDAPNLSILLKAD